MATLNIFCKDQLMDIVPLPAGENCIIGRDTACEVVFNEKIVSFHHAKIESHGKACLLTDLNSTNGTFVNGKKAYTIWLNDGDSIAVGNHTLLFSNPLSTGVRKELQPLVKDTMSIHSGLFKVRQQKGNLRISGQSIPESISSMVLVQLPGHIKVISLMDKSITLGKALVADIVVKGFGVGKIAAKIEKLADGWYLRYIGGFVRPRVNGEFPKKPIRLKEFDIISLGKTKMQVQICSKE
jgi:pSer/pThr/pTyr-binding forkhead associated (FHA) protein